MKPLVSVIMPVYNGEKYLEEAINSIVNQTYSNFELIIINDGSEDHTQDILESYSDTRIKLISRENKGLIYSLNQGIGISEGKYIARHDCDDISMNNRLKIQVAFLEKNPDYVIVGSPSILIDADGKYIRFAKTPLKDTDIRWHSLFYSAFHHPTVMLRSNLFKEHRMLYNAEDIHAEDMGLWLKVLDYGKALNVSKPLIKRRIHFEQVSQIFSDTQTYNSLLITQRNFDRYNFTVTIEEMKKLRIWYYRFPKFWGFADIKLIKRLLTFAYQFKTFPLIDEKVLNNNIWHLTDRLFNPLYWFQKHFRKSGIYALLYKNDKKGIHSYPLRFFMINISKLITLWNEIISRLKH